MATSFILGLGVGIVMAVLAIVAVACVRAGRSDAQRGMHARSDGDVPDLDRYEWTVDRTGRHIRRTWLTDGSFYDEEVIE